MWYGFQDKHHSSYSRLSADPYHMRGSGTGFGTDAADTRVCPQTRTSVPHEVRVCGQTGNPATTHGEDVHVNHSGGQTAWLIHSIHPGDLPLTPLPYPPTRSAQLVSW